MLAADPDAAGHDDLLDVGGAARMESDDGRTLVGLNVTLAGSPLLVLGQGRGAQDVQDAGGDTQAGLLAEVGCLGSLVGDVAPLWRIQ